MTISTCTSSSNAMLPTMLRMETLSSTLGRSRQRITSGNAGYRSQRNDSLFDLSVAQRMFFQGRVAATSVTFFAETAGYRCVAIAS